MRVFLDTNVILEYFTVREEYVTAQRLFDRFHQEGDVLYMSVGSFYTMVFLIDKVLRKETNLRGESRLKALRDIMERILRTVSVAEHDSDSLLHGLLDRRFKDIEDGCQFELAKKVCCEMLVTFNVEDFPVGADDEVKVISPTDFLNMRS